MAIKDLQIHETLMAAGMEKVVLLYPYRSEGLPARDPYPENWDSVASLSAHKRKIESLFQNQASVRPSQTTVNESI
jgi:hypothetical protein